MFDTMTVTKAAAGFFGAFLVFLLGKWAAEEIYHVGGHGEAAYIVEPLESNDTISEAEEVNFDELMMAAEVDKGANVFKKCQACHKLEDGANGTGPYLYGVVGRPVAAAAGFGYSAAMQDKGGDWTVEELDAFLANPRSALSGTSMAFTGLKKQSDRINLIAYLDSLDN
ncbi:cytochrome c family protein [Ruegeria sp. 2205SS24-7]|uniref:c-type cytochrome n=1 Tax=Ruegeria discodermiae TaxID=3064389 RepID=UPI0027417C24|nr:cytochrome c family protein [Ruegeria sp. 2205SS24-7]MDP5219615.1 cytochrome c family protein [Ruegeria sp. 2205SS24-7]